MSWRPEAYALITPSTEEEWASYHRIRRTILFERRGQFGVYDPNRPDERKPGNFPKLLICDSHHVGVVRIDVSADVAYLRRVAIDEPWQRQGLGRLLLALAESFAIEHGARRLESSVAVDAVAFYSKCGYRSRQSVAGNVDTHMFKDLARGFISGDPLDAG
jgi:GNAT superfamily N-acetyltransferase